MHKRRPLAWLLLGGVLVSCGSDNSTGPRVPAAIVILPNQPVIAQGLTLSLTATVVDAAGRAIPGQHVTFTSSDTAVATVNAAGLVLSRGPLSPVRITAALGSLTNFVDVAVRQRIVGVQVTPNPVILNTQFFAQLAVSIVDFAGNPVSRPGAVTFQSSDPAIAAVDANGLVQSPGLLTGNVTITVRADTFVVLVPVTVTQIPNALGATPHNVVMAPGSTQQLSSIVRDLSGRVIAGAAVTFSGSIPGVFSVSSSGLITAGNSTGSGRVVASYALLRDTVGVFVGTAPPGTVLQTTPVPGAGYAAAVTANGTVIVSLAGTSTAMVGTVQSLAFSDTVIVGSEPLGVDVNPAGTLAYVALNNNSGLAVVNLATKVVTHTPVGPNGTSLLSVLASSDGQAVYVGTPGWVFKLDAATLTTLDSTPANFPLHLAAHPTLPRIYASMQGSGYVEEIDTGTMDSLRSFGPGSGIQAVGVAGDGSTLYVANEGTGNVSTFDLGTGAPGLTITTAGGAFGLVVGGSVVYVASSLSSSVEAFDRTSGTRLYGRNVSGFPRRPALTAGGILIVPNEGGWVDFIQ